MSRADYFPPSAYAEYFVPIARKVFDAWLAQHGLRWAGVRNRTRANWARGRLWFSVEYWPETRPRYELLFATGEFEGANFELARPGLGIGIWRLFPQKAQPKAGDWEFRDAEQLREVLTTVWDTQIVPYVAPLWRPGDGRLSAVIAETERQLREQEAAERRGRTNDRHLRSARDHFAARRYRESVREYENVDDDALTNADRKRFEIARKRV